MACSFREGTSAVIQSQQALQGRFAFSRREFAERHADCWRNASALGDMSAAKTSAESSTGVLLGSPRPFCCSSTGLYYPRSLPLPLSALFSPLRAAKLVPNHSSTPPSWINSLCLWQ